MTVSNAILVTVAKIAAKRSRDVVILPKMSLPTSGSGVLICHPTSKYKAWLTGNVEGVAQVDLSVFQESMFLNLLTCTWEFTLATTDGRVFFLVRVASVNVEHDILKAVGQALALSELTKARRGSYLFDGNGRFLQFSPRMPRVNVLITYQGLSALSEAIFNRYTCSGRLWNWHYNGSRQPLRPKDCTLSTHSRVGYKSSSGVPSRGLQSGVTVVNRQKDTRRVFFFLKISVALHVRGVLDA